MVPWTARKTTRERALNKHKIYEITCFPSCVSGASALCGGLLGVYARKSWSFLLYKGEDELS